MWRWRVCSEPNRVGGVYFAIEDALQNHAGISIHGSRTKVWNASGVRPPACDALEEIARTVHPTARVWRGSGVPTEQQGMKILGTPLFGHPDYVRRHLGELAEEQRLLLQRIPRVKDVQGACFLLVHCASAQTNFFLRSVRPEAVAEYARLHDAGLWECFSRILQVDLSTFGQETHDVATLPFVLGGLGLRSAVRTSVPACCASWADCMPMIRERHPQVAKQFAAFLEGHPDTPHLREAAAAVRSLHGVMEFEPPSWVAVATGARQEAREPEDYEPGSVRAGWQHEAASRVERHFRDEHVFPQMENPRKAIVRSQGGPGAGLSFLCCPTYPFTTLSPQLFRVMLLRRLGLPLPLTSLTCRCGRPLGHHRTACARAGVLGRQGFALESVLARICRKAGGRVTTNIMVCDLDLEHLQGLDGKRLEVVVDGLPLFGGVQLAVDTTMVSALRGDGTARRLAADVDGVVLEAARKRKARTYPELVGVHRRAQLVVIAVEVGGRWSTKTRSFLSQLAKAKARGETHLMRQRTEQAWRLRWGSLLSCVAARAVATSLLELPGARGADGETPAAADVEEDSRNAGLTV